MKKIALIIGVLLLAVGGYMYTAKTSKSNNSSMLPVAQAEVIKLYRESGTVIASREGIADVTLTNTLDSVDITTGTTVRTDVKSTAYVIFPDNSMMSIDASTDVVIQYAPEKISILQAFGNTYHRVRTLESGQQYEVKTPGTLAAVRGTKFAVLYDSVKKKGKVLVTESKVQVFKTDATKPLEEVTQDALAKQPSVLVQQDTFLETDRNATALAVPQPVQVNDRNDGGWIQKNDAIDVIFNTEEKDGQKTVEKIRELRKNVIESVGENSDIESAVTQVLFMIGKDEKADVKKILNELKDRMQEKKDAVVQKVPLVPTKEVVPILKDPDQKLPPKPQGSLEEGFENVYENLFPVYADKATFCAQIKGLTEADLQAQLAAAEKVYGAVIPNKEQVFVFLRKAKEYCIGSPTDAEFIQEAYSDQYPF